MGHNAYSDKEKVAAQERKTRFLAALRGDEGEPLTVRAACDVVGVTRKTVRMWRENDPEFESSYSDAMDDGTDLMETEATRRAMRGVEQPVYQGGDLVGTKTVYSDDLMKFMLAGRAPSRFRSGQDVNVSVASSNVVNDEKAIARALALMLAEAQKRKSLASAPGDSRE